ncbi:MAG: 23S rRNA pseudouridine(2604) synthase RluF [Crocinitomicaceae bacterium]|nr:23S rRNA pseudouridine(2604) synthase RluF [Crocinitomicaceae bacterium]
MREENTIRLNKYISESGICSRREADKFIESKKVFINGRCARMGDQVGPTDEVRVNGIIIEPRGEDEAIYILFNKPPGITSTTDIKEKDNIISYINYGERIFPVGRLDKDSQGLLILTSNGDIVNKILRAGNNHEKEYVVTVDKPVTDQFIKGMSNGVPILGVNTKKCKIVRESNYVFTITLIQGLNRQIRRMCEHFGYEVLKLDRVRIMNLSLKGIPLGEYRELKKHELEELNALLKDAPPEKEKAKPVQAVKPSATKKPAPKKPGYRKPEVKTKPEAKEKSESASRKGPKKSGNRPTLKRTSTSSPSKNKGRAGRSGR